MCYFFYIYLSILLFTFFSVIGLCTFINRKEKKQKMNIIKKGNKRNNIKTMNQQERQHALDLFKKYDAKCKTVYGCGSIFKITDEDMPRIKSYKDSSRCFSTFFIKCPVCGKNLYEYPEDTYVYPTDAKINNNLKELETLPKEPFVPIPNGSIRKPRSW